MKIYLAGAGGKPWLKDNFFDFYRLDSYEYLKKGCSAELKFLNTYKDFILDSGIFSYLNGKDCSNMDWEKYITEYGNFVINNNISKYVEVDIDSIIGLDLTEILRKKLEKLVGRKSIPVWHINRGYDKWLEICRDYDYICFGAFITDGLKKEKYYMIKKFLQSAQHNSCKVHGLGFTNFEWLKKLKFYSVDSSSWTIGSRYGTLSIYQGDKVKNLNRPKGSRIKNMHKLSSHNFYEWVKYQKWADVNL